MNFHSMDTDQLKGSFKSRAELIRAILRAEVEKGRPSELRTLRELWYEAVKIPLMRFEPDKSSKGGWGRKASQALSAVLSEMVLSGELKYRDIGIQDQSRAHIDGEQPFDEVIVFVEDHATFDKLRDVARAYRITMIEGQGFEATALIEKLQTIDYFWRRKRYLLLAMTDYDAFGFKILDDLTRRMRELGFDVTSERVGITPEDVPEEDLDSLKFPIPLNCPYDEEWADDYGIDGAFGLELQAVDGARRREILIQALEQHCPEGELYQYLRAESWAWIPEEAVEVLVERIMGTVKEQVETKVRQLQSDRRLRDDRSDLSDGTVQRWAKSGGRFHQKTGHLPGTAVDLVMDLLEDISFDGHRLSIEWQEGEDPDEEDDDNE